MIEKKMNFRVIIPVLILLFIFTGCSFFKKEPMVRHSPEGLYARGSAEFNNGDYKKAREFFTRLKDEFPLHNMAILAELGIADSYYTDKQYAEAQAAYSDFINMHPTNENIPYVLYQTGMCYYDQIGTIDRDQTQTIQAKKEFERLIARFPDSKFAKIAEKLLWECNQKLAEKEFYVGKYYFRNKNYQAALKRFEFAKNNYVNSSISYKLDYYIDETKKYIADEEKLKKEAEEKEKQKADKK